MYFLADTLLKRGLFMSKQALYLTVYNTLKQEITEGILKVGSLLPTEQELEERFQVSRTTVRKAIGLLKDEGYLDVRQGRGTTVQDITTTQKLSHISSITETLINDGHEVSVQSMSITKIQAPDSMSDIFAPGTPLYCLERVLCSDGLPINYSTTYLLAEMVPHFEQYVNMFCGLYHFLETKYHIQMSEATETLSASAANFAESQILNIPQGSPLLISKRVTNVGDIRFEYGINRLVGGRYKYIIHMNGR